MHDEEESFEVRRRRHAQGYSPQPPAPDLTSWRAPDLTEQEKEERNQLIEAGELQF